MLQIIFSEILQKCSQTFDLRHTCVIKTNKIVQLFREFMSLTKPIIAQIRSLSTKQSFKRGKDYYKDKCILSADITHDIIRAQVYGTQKYNVRISTDFEELNCYCTCSYIFEGICKHAVAVLLHASENFEQMLQDEIKRKARIDKLFFDISTKRLKEFLKKEIECNGDLQIKFSDYFEKDYMPSKDYKSEINSMYRNAAGEYGIVQYGYEIDFEEFNKIAKSKEKKGDYVEAAQIYQDIAESISENMEYVDDSDGHYGECFSDALCEMSSCITLQTLTHQEKQQYISYMFEKYIKNDPDYFSENYTSSLKQICTNKYDYTYWKNLLEPHLPKTIPNEKYLNKHYLAKEKLSIQIHILRKLKDKSIEDIFTAHYCDDEDICLSYIKYLKKNNPDKTSRIVEEGLENHPRSVQLKEMVLQTCKKTDSKYKKITLELYFDTLKSKYYLQLKSLPNWNNTFDVIIKHFTKHKSYHILIGIYLTEKMYPDVLKQVISRNNIPTLLDYHKKLAPLYPKEYFEAYCKGILKFACSNTGRDHYKKTKSYLRKIKTIPKHKTQFKILVDTIKTQNSTKPAFLDELKNI